MAGRCPVCYEPAAYTCSGCPYEPDESAVCQCKMCGEPLYCGDFFWDIEGDAICDACISDMTGPELARWFGYELKEMTSYEADDRREIHED